MADLMVTLWRRLGVSPGAKAAMRFTQQLASLPGEWHVLHTGPISRSANEVDHLVIGPGGVFNVTAKCHPNATVWLNDDVLRVNGHRTEYLREARSEAEHVTRVLSAALGTRVESIPVIVFVDLLKLTAKGRPDGLLVSTSRSVRNLLRRQPRRLTPEQIERIHCVARDAFTRQPV